ncbi:UNVERIFIED_CONTAM: DNA polymerase [Sesamum calycinum]|uniref:DNA-directed DNA polymerase n=1 Tax=Sesamum calycinum TaxID=2727403 RepID=A0AAW2KWU1_9LAMI
MLRGGETRCSAVWSAHLFWVQRAIGSNPVTLMWGRSQPQTGSIAASDNKIIHIEFENENLRCGLAFDIQCWLTAAPPETLTDKIRFNLAVPSSWAFSARPHLHDFEPGRDSLTLLPGNLASLGNTLCPELGSKGSIQHENLVVSDLQVNSENLINYLRQDILILGGVMLKAQEINWSKYQIDVEDVMTITSLSLKIFRKLYFDDNAFHINIPTRNQDTFIRRGYYGGHVDVYKPHGENLYYYDVNSLYPYIMKSYPMPSGDPVWKNNLESVELDSLFGFIEAYVIWYESRKYCNRDLQSRKYDEMMMKDNFQSADKLNDDYIVNYISNSQIVDDTEWKAPKHSAVQLSAAITACARIHMYPHISREDCYYTDTDSIVLGSPLSDDLVSSKEMGKFKLENHVKKGIFLAPKSYMLEIEDDQHIIKHKGPAKDLVTSEWFQKVLEDPSLTEKIATSANFRIDWKELKIVKKDIIKTRTTTE